MGADFWIVLQWWGTMFLVGAMAFPLTRALFTGRATRSSADGNVGWPASNASHSDAGWWDHGYFFAKAVGMAFVTYVVYLGGMLHVTPFTTPTIFGALIGIFAVGLWVNYLNNESGIMNHGKEKQKRIIHNSCLAGRQALFMIQGGKSWVKGFALIVSEELIFFIALLFWAWVKGHEPSIHGLEKFMDYGFMKSILNSPFFPAPDMWFAGYPINYYYFGHTVVAVLTRLSGIDLAYTFNLMLSTIFALTLTMSFSIGYQLFWGKGKGERGKLSLGGGILTALLVTLAGNMQTIYAFTKGYMGENPPAFWTLLWKFSELGQIGEGLGRYWYANATRFIPFTIHEFPGYSFVVSDVHGHVLSLPFVLLAIALLISMAGERGKGKGESQTSFFILHPSPLMLIFYGFLVAILLMTNALDGPIYLGLFFVLFAIHYSVFSIREKKNWKQIAYIGGVVIGTAAAASIPFMNHFKSFVSGLAINCPPGFLAGQKIGIFLFEGAEKCQRSPIWMMWLLWGFFIYCGGWLIMRIFNFQFSIFNKMKKFSMNTKITQHELTVVVFFFFSIALIIFPEFFYFKDIYPAHFRSNTMFKLGYEAFILFSIVSGYAIVRVIRDKQKVFLMFLIPQLFLVLVYPIFSVRSYFDSLRTYKGINGLMWFKNQYPDDYAGIAWLNKQAISVKGKGVSEFSSTLNASPFTLPVIVEADGDSYTDYARFSAFTGLPTIIGWPVHEWLWRGTYDVVAPRREEVRIVYESDDLEATRAVFQKYNVRYVVVGYLERQKFTNMNTEKFEVLGTLVFTQGTTQIYDVNN